MIIETAFGTFEVTGETTGKAWGKRGAEWITYKSNDVRRGDVWISVVATSVKRGRKTVYLTNGDTDKNHPSKSDALERISSI